MQEKATIQENTTTQGRTVSYSKTEQVHLVQPADLNGGGRLFGGNLLKMIDEVAAIVAMRHTGLKTVTTAAIDNLVFKSGAYVNDLIVLIGYITYTGRTSMDAKSSKSELSSPALIALRHATL